MTKGEIARIVVWIVAILIATYFAGYERGALHEDNIFERVSP